MSEEAASMFSRIGRWFRRRFGNGDDLPLLRGETETTTSIVRRPMFGIFGRREVEDLSTLQNGLASMSALMASLRQYLDQQNARHDELLNYLSQLSHALQAIPDAGRVQGETLRVLHQQIAYQNAQHKQLSEMLRKVSENSGTSREMVEMLRDRVETLYKNDQQIADTIGGMGNSITVVSQQSQTNTMVLERLRDNLVNRDSELDQTVRREARITRGTLMLVAATSLLALLIAIGMTLYSWSAISRVAESVRARTSPAPHSAPDLQPGAALPENPAVPGAAVARPAATGPATAPTVP